MQKYARISILAFYFCYVPNGLADITTIDESADDVIFIQKHKKDEEINMLGSHPKHHHSSQKGHHDGWLGSIFDMLNPMKNLKYLAGAEKKDVEGALSFFVGESIKSAFHEVWEIVLKLTGNTWTEAEATGDPYIYYEGNKKVTLPLKNQTGFVFEILYSIKPKQNGMKLNATHAWVPFHTVDNPIQASYVKRQDNLLSYGIVNWIYWAEPMSIFSDDTRVGSFEKRLSFKQKSKIDALPSDPALPTKELPQPGFFMGAIYKFKRVIMNLMILASLGHGQVIRASGMPNSDIVDYAKSEGKPSAAFAKIASDLSKHLPTKPAPVYHSATSCFHLAFEWEWPSSNFADIPGFWVPLNTKIVSFKGENYNAPFKAFDGNQGISVWSYDEAEDRLNVAYGVSLDATLGNPWHKTEGGEYDKASSTKGDMVRVGHADGESWPIVVKAGNTNYAHNPIPAILGAIVRHLPGDPNFLKQPQSVVCPEQLKRELMKDMDSVSLQRWFEQIIQFHRGKSVFRSLTLTGFLAGLEIAGQTWHMTEAVGCAAAGIAPVTHETIEYDVGIATAYLHACTEIPSSQLLSIVGSPGLRQVNPTLMR